MKKLHFNFVNKRELGCVLLGMVLAFGMLSYQGCEDISSDGESISGSFNAESVPLLPKGFPLYPQAFTTSGVYDPDEYGDDPLEEILDNLLDELDIDVPLVGDINVGDYLPNDAQDTIKDVLEWIVGGRVPFFDPGPMSASINSQITSLFKDAVTFSEASLNLGIRNNSDDWWGVPIRFSMYVGEPKDVFSKDSDARAGALVRTDESDECDCTFVLEPGELKEVTTENLVGLVTALNELNGIAMDYDTDIPVDRADWGELYNMLKSSSPSDLGSWRLSVETFEVNISGEGKIEIPFDVPDWVKDFAENL